LKIANYTVFFYYLFTSPDRNPDLEFYILFKARLLRFARNDNVLSLRGALATKQSHSQ